MSRFHFLFCLFLLTAPLSGQTNSPIPSVPPGTNLKDPNALLPLAIAANSLDRAGVPPYYLKATYETFDEQGKQQDSGTFEEWRLAPDKSKRVYTGTHFSQTEYETSAGVYYETNSGAAPWPISLVGKELVHPGPEETETKDTEPELRPVDAKGSLKLTCLTLSPPSKKMEWPLGVLPTYCFTSDSVTLRLEIFHTMMQAIRNDMAEFHGVSIAKEIEVSDERKPLLRIHLISLASMSAGEIATTNALPGFTRIASPQPTVEHGKPIAAVMSGRRIGGPAPSYPEEARIRRLHGTVILSVLIGTDGRIHDVKLVSSPDEWLAMSAMAAVGRWVYTPYTLLGKPVTVETKVNVVY